MMMNEQGQKSTE